MKNKFIIFVIIIAAIAGIAGYWYYQYQKKIFSKEDLKLEILGPSKAQSLEEVEYTVEYKNNGNITLEDAKLIFECPKNSLECVLVEKEESPEEKKSLRKDLPLQDIYPGQGQSLRIRARLLGKKNETKKAKAILSYRLKNLKAVYDSPTTFTTQIESVPLSFEFDLSSRAESGRKIKFFLNYSSYVDYPLSNLGIKIDYPVDFQFLESDPSALGETNWEISSLNKTEGGRIEINGILTGEVGKPRIFGATLGLWQDGEFVVLKEATKLVEITKPSLRLTQFINGSSDYIANIGDLLHYEIYFKNIGEKPFEQLDLIARLNGELFDFQTIKSDLGECEPGDRSVIWRWERVSGLRFLDAEKEGKVEFWINLKEKKEFEGLEDSNFSLKNSIGLLGQTREEFVTKVNSKLEITQKAYIDDEIFGSEGPLPPKVDEKSFFTVIWRIKNFYNQAENVKVKASLPPEVKLTGEIFPQEASFTFDSKSREIIWQVGNLEPGQGLKEPVQLAFQVALTPTKEQEGKAATLVSEVKISGEDQWTESFISGSDLLIKTDLPVE